MKHSKLADGIEQAVSDTKYLPPGVEPDSVSVWLSINNSSALSAAPHLPPPQLEICYSPIIQSGGQYMLKFSTVSSDERLHFGTIVCCLGLRYKSYCSNIVRTMFVEPTKVCSYVVSWKVWCDVSMMSFYLRRCRIITLFCCLCMRDCWRL